MSSPNRKKRHDRILGGMSSADEIRCDMVTGPLDEATRQMDRKWGVDRLPDLVGIQTADKWGQALANLNAAIQSGDVEITKARTAACIRGLAVMDAEAVAAGASTSDPDIWEAEHDGMRVGVIRDGVEWQAAAAKRPDLTIVFMKELVVALHAYRSALPVVNAVKGAFGGAHIVNIKNREDQEDAIPF